MWQENQEVKGFVEAFRGLKPSSSEHKYLEEYAKGYNAYFARTGRKTTHKQISTTCFILGYTDALQKRQPALQEKDYFEGYMLAISNSKSPNKTLDDYFEIERDVLIWKFTKND